MNCPECGGEMIHGVEYEDGGLGYSRVVYGWWECAECDFTMSEYDMIKRGHEEKVR